MLKAAAFKTGFAASTPVVPWSWAARTLVAGTSGLVMKSLELKKMPPAAPE